MKMVHKFCLSAPPNLKPKFRALPTPVNRNPIRISRRLGTHRDQVCNAATVAFAQQPRTESSVAKCTTGHLCIGEMQFHWTISRAETETRLPIPTSFRESLTLGLWPIVERDSWQISGTRETNSPNRLHCSWRQPNLSLKPSPLDRKARSLYNALLDLSSNLKTDARRVHSHES